MKTCPKCSFNNENDAVFCCGCGNRIDDIPVDASPSDPQQQAEPPVNENNDPAEIHPSADESNGKCPDCGSPIEDGAAFCEVCGRPLKNSSNTTNTFTQPAPNVYENNIHSAQNNIQAEVNNSTYYNADNSMNDEKNKGVFIESGESTIASLGTGYLQSIISSSSVKAVLTQKRVYFSGKAFTLSGKSWIRTKVSKIVDIEDVTGTGFVHTKNIYYLVFSIILLIIAIAIACFLRIPINYLNDYADINLNGTKIGLIAGAIVLLFALIDFLIFIFSRKTLFQVEYAGGAIGFNVKWINNQSSINFQRQIHLVKAKMKQRDYLR